MFDQGQRMDPSFYRTLPFDQQSIRCPGGRGSSHTQFLETTLPDGSKQIDTGRYQINVTQSKDGGTIKIKDKDNNDSTPQSVGIQIDGDPHLRTLNADGSTSGDIMFKGDLDIKLLDGTKVSINTASHGGDVTYARGVNISKNGDSVYYNNLDTKDKPLTTLTGDAAEYQNYLDHADNNFQTMQTSMGQDDQLYRQGLYGNMKPVTKEWIDRKDQQTDFINKLSDLDNPFMMPPQMIQQLLRQLMGMNPEFMGLSGANYNFSGMSQWQGQNYQMQNFDLNPFLMDVQGY